MKIIIIIYKTDYKDRTWEVYKGYYTLIKDEKNHNNTNAIR